MYKRQVSSGSNNSFLLGSLAADTKSGCLGWIGAGVDTGVGDLLPKLIHMLFVQNRFYILYHFPLSGAIHDGGYILLGVDRIPSELGFQILYKLLKFL